MATPAMLALNAASALQNRCFCFLLGGACTPRHYPPHIDHFLCAVPAQQPHSVARARPRGPRMVSRALVPAVVRPQRSNHRNAEATGTHSGSRGVRFKHATAALCAEMARKSEEGDAADSYDEHDAKYLGRGGD